MFIVLLDKIMNTVVDDARHCQDRPRGTVIDSCSAFVVGSFLFSPIEAQITRRENFWNQLVIHILLGMLKPALRVFQPLLANIPWWPPLTDWNENYFNKVGVRFVEKLTPSFFMLLINLLFSCESSTWRHFPFHLRKSHSLAVDWFLCLAHTTV